MAEQPDQTLTTNQLLDVEPARRAILLMVMRRGQISHDELLTLIGGDPARASSSLNQLELKGLLIKDEEAGKIFYRVCLSQAGTHPLEEADLQHKSGLHSLYASQLVPAAKEDEPGSQVQAAHVLLYMLMLAIVNSFVLGVLDVVAISGFVENLETRNMPQLWIAEMVAGVLFSGFYLQSIDRIARLRMVNLLLGGLAGLYLLFGSLFALGISTRILFPALYLIQTQQVILFPIAFWNVANELYSMTSARRIFPRLASGEMVGRLIGYALFSLPGLIGLTQLEKTITNSPAQLLWISAGLYVMGVAHSLLLFRKTGNPAPAAARQPVHSLRKSLIEGLETIREVSLFRYLTISVTLEWVALIILWYLFYQSLEINSAENGGFALNYSLFNIAYLIAPLLLQWRLTGHLLKRLPPRDVPLGLPLVILLGVLVGLFIRNSLGVVLAIFLPMVVYNAWDLPALQAMLDLVPTERRGRVRALLNNYSYAAGMILGSLLLTGLHLVESVFPPDQGLFRLLALMLALFAALGAVTSALWTRATYEESLLSWRLARRQRSSGVLEKLK